MRVPWLPTCLFFGVALVACEVPPPADAIPVNRLAALTLQEVIEVGSVGGPETAFGRITDVKSTADGSFLVLDTQPASVSWIGLDGTYRSGVRSTGQGPGELAQPLGMSVKAGDRLGVVDPRNTRLSIYRLNPDNSVVFEAAVRGAWSVLSAERAVCNLDDTWYVHQWQGGQLIHAISESGVVERSFSPEIPVDAEEFGPFTALAAPQINAGTILCIGRGSEQLVLSIEVFSSIVRAHTSDGRLVWSADIRGVRPRRVVINERGALSLEALPPSGLHVARSLVSWTDSTAIVQFSLDLPTRKESDYHGIESIELALRDGREVGRSSTLPLIVDRRGSLLYSLRNRPYPMVTVYDRGR